MYKLTLLGPIVQELKVLLFTRTISLLVTSSNNETVLLNYSISIYVSWELPYRQSADAELFITVKFSPYGEFPKPLFFVTYVNYAIFGALINKLLT